MKRKRLRFYNMKPIGYFVTVLAVTKYKTIEIVFVKKGEFSIKLDFDYRPKTQDHKVFLSSSICPIWNSNLSFMM